MKHFIFFLTGLFLLVSCTDTSEQTMLVSGNVKGLKKGTLYLQTISDTTLITIDSLVVKGQGDFEFKTTIESPEIYYLYLKKEDNNDINDRIRFFGEPGHITIMTQWNDFEKKAKIEGSETQKKLEEYQKVMTRFNAQNLEQLQASVDPEIQNNQLALDSLQQAYEKNIKRSYLYALNFALNNTGSHIAPYIAMTEVANANVIYLDSIYTSLSPEVANGRYGKALEKHLAEIKKK